MARSKAAAVKWTIVARTPGEPAYRPVVDAPVCKEWLDADAASAAYTWAHPNLDIRTAYTRETAENAIVPDPFEVAWDATPAPAYDVNRLGDPTYGPLDTPEDFNEDEEAPAPYAVPYNVRREGWARILGKPAAVRLSDSIVVVGTVSAPLAHMSPEYPILRMPEGTWTRLDNLVWLLPVAHFTSPAPAPMGAPSEAVVLIAVPISTTGTGDREEAALLGRLNVAGARAVTVTENVLDVLTSAALVGLEAAAEDGEWMDAAQAEGAEHAVRVLAGADDTTAPAHAAA